MLPRRGVPGSTVPTPPRKGPMSEHIRAALDAAGRAGRMRRASYTHAVSRRTLLRGAGLGAVAAAGVTGLAGCGVQPVIKAVPLAQATGYAGQDYSDVEKVVDFSNWPSYIDVNANNQSDHPTLDMFTKATGIKVNYNEEINDNNDFYTKIDPMLATGRDTGRDIIVMSDYMIPVLRERDYIQELDLANIPNHRNVIPDVLHDPIDPGRRFTLPWAYGYTTIAYNTKLVSEPVTSFKELFERRDLAGQVTLFSEMEDTVAAALFALGRNPADFSAEDFSDALNYVNEAKRSGQVRQFSGNDYLSDFQAGNVAATLAYSGDVAALGIKYLVTVDLPEDGLLSWSDNMCIPNFARHKKNAELLMNWYYNPKIAALLDDYIDYIPSVEGGIAALAAIDPAAAANPLIVPTAAMRAKACGFMNLTIDQLQSFTDRFQQIAE